MRKIDNRSRMRVSDVRAWFVLTAMIVILLPACRARAAVISSEDIPNFIKTQYSIEQGLPTDEANAVVQDQSGYLWIGGYGGLIRYDGTNFVNYSDRLESSAIRSLYVDSAGRLYVGTNDAGVYRLEDDVFTRLRVPDSQEYLCIRRFCENSEGVVYAASTSGIVRVDPDELVPVILDDFSTEQFVTLTIDRCDRIWALADSAVLYEFTEDAFIQSYTDADFFQKDTISAVCADTEGSLYVSSSGDCIVKLTIGEEGDVLQQDEFYTSELASINKLSPGPDGVILVCGLRGFGTLNPQDGFLLVDKDVIDGNWAIVDHEGNYWVASSGSCLQRYCLGCFDSCNFNSTLGTMTVNVVYQEGNLYYVGTDTGVYVYNKEWAQVSNRATRVLSGVRVRTIGSDTAGRLWISAWNEGVVRFDPGTGETMRFSTENGLNSDKVRVIYRLSDGRMLLGNQQGAAIMDAAGEKVETVYGAEDGMETTSVLSAMEQSGHLYLGTDGSGIYEITQDGLVHLGYDQGLTQGVVLRMTADADGSGNFFVCAGDKLFYFEEDSRSFRQLDQITKGAGSFYSVYDVNGRIWALQNSGVFSVDKEDLLAGRKTYTARYGTECGLTGSLAANTWCWLSENQRLYIPTHAGVSAFDFEGKEIVMPRAIVNTITVDGTVYEHPSYVEVPSSAKRVTADISLLLFSDAADYEIAYRLDGFDQEDTVTTKRNVSVSYTNLKGGDYTLKIRIINPLTGETAEAEDVIISRASNITESLWFWIALVIAAFLVLFGIGYIIARRRLKKARETEEAQRRIIDQALITIAGTIDAKDLYTKGHSVRVATYSREIARRLGMPEEYLKQIYYIGLLHDIGKIGVPDEVLNKKGRLTDEEFMQIKKHPAIGGEILQSFDAVQGISDGAKYHHERYDGRGYCEGLSGEEIPLVARIIGVADSYDAMQSNRVYRPGLSEEVILNELKKNAGTQFDPKIVPIMCEMIADGFAPMNLKDDRDAPELHKK